MGERESSRSTDPTREGPATSGEPEDIDPLETRVRIRVARFVGFSVGITALFLWALWTGDPITGALAAVPIGYLAYRAELMLVRRLDVRFLEFFG